MDVPDIKFGTDGWRGIIADDFTFDNVALVGSAIARYLAETGQHGKPLLIGFDRRFGAESYAAHLATHLAAEGLAVVVISTTCPTPVTAFGVAHLQAAGAIMLTASHNPYYYQGLKFIPYFAGPAMPETTDRITALIHELAPDFTPPPLALEWSGKTVALREAYFAHLDKTVNSASLSSSGWRVLYDPMHGVGAGYLDGYLNRSGVATVTINAARDVYFGGECLPDPSPANLKPLAPRLVAERCDVLIGTDGDADRFGIVDPEGRYFSANQALPLLADFLIRFKQRRGALVRTVATSHLLDSLAREQGLELIETAVGFKYVGDALRHGALIGGEESGGISIQGHMPEKDGILASLLMLEMAATMGDGFDKLYHDLQQRLGPRAFVRIDQELPDERKLILMAKLREHTQPKFAGRKIAQRITIDGVKFVFDDGCWMLVRPSGTEPLIRVYVEATPPDVLPRLKSQVLDELKALA